MLSHHLETAISETLDLDRRLSVPSVAPASAREAVVALVHPFAVKSAEATLLLVRSNYSHQAVPLARCFLEVTINLLYAEKAEHRDHQYQRLWDFRWHEVGRLLEQNAPALNHCWTPEVLRDVAEARRRHGWDRKTTDWSDRDHKLREKAQRVGLRAEYDLGYRWLSQSVHGTPVGLGGATVKTADGGTVFTAEGSEVLRLKVLIALGSCLPAHVELWASVFLPGQAAEVHTKLEAIWGPIVRQTAGGWQPE